MTTDEIVELAIQGHASTRDAIRWAILQEREQCAQVADIANEYNRYISVEIASSIRLRGEK